MEKQKGFVVWYSEAKGFGFIRVRSDDATPKDYFVHVTKLLSPHKKPRLTTDDVVEFNVEPCEKGEQAVNVVCVGGDV